MQEKNIDEIIRLVLTGEASMEERLVLRHWLAKSDDNLITFQQLQLIWDERDPEPPLPHAGQISEQIWTKALQTEEKLDLPVRKVPALFNFSHYIKTAAVILLVIGLPFLLFFYSSKQGPAVVEVQMIEKKTTIGQKSKITLPDGSVAWLNADSKIQYAANFQGTTRTVKLVGEGYFEVKETPNKPFIVQSGNVSTRAVGTAFNIRAYPEDSLVQIALLSGKVQVKSPQMNNAHASETLHLHEGDGVRYNKHINRASTYQFDQQAVMAWKQGILVFDGDSFEEVKNKIRRWYGVDVRITGTPPTDWKLSGKFKNEPLSSVLENIRFGRKFSYELHGTQLNLLFEPPKP